MKRFLFWILKLLAGCLAGLSVFIGLTIGGSYYLTTESKLPSNEILFEDIVLEVNGMQWNVPLIAGIMDKQFSEVSTLSVQKIGLVDSVRPVFTFPEWVTHATLSIEDANGEVLFTGNMEEYAEFAYPQNGSYKAELLIWYLPEGFTEADYNAIGTGTLLMNPNVETPAKPIGWYNFNFRFELEAAAQVVLSSETAESGEIVALAIHGFLGDDAPIIETDLGDIEPLRIGSQWRAYIPVSHNTPMGDYTISVTTADKTVETVLTVKPKDFDSVIITQPSEIFTEADNSAYRDAIISLYDDPATPKAWVGSWVMPVSEYSVLVDYGANQWRDNKLVSISNLIEFGTETGQPVFAPTGGTVVYAGELALTGGTVVIDHGHSVRTYFYGMDIIDVKQGDMVIHSQVIGTTSTELSMDVKIVNKSVNPWELFHGKGGLFWQE